MRGGLTRAFTVFIEGSEMTFLAKKRSPSKN